MYILNIMMNNYTYVHLYYLKFIHCIKHHNLYSSLQHNFLSIRICINRVVSNEILLIFII